MLRTPGLGQAEKGIAQTLGAVIFPGRVGFRHRPLGEFGQRLSNSLRQRALDESQAADGCAPQICVDALAQGAALVLEKQGRTRLGTEGQGAARGAFPELDRLGEPCGFGPCDLFPAKDQGGIAEAGA